MNARGRLVLRHIFSLSVDGVNCHDIWHDAMYFVTDLFAYRWGKALDEMRRQRVWTDSKA